MAQMRLTDRSIRALKPRPGKRLVVTDRVTPGLALRCTENGVKTFYFVYRNGARVRWLRLGEYDDLKLADARDEVRNLRGQRVHGVDPVMEKRKARGAKTFDQLARQFVEHLHEKEKKSWRNYWWVLVGGALPDAKRVVKHKKRSRAVAFAALWKDRPLDSITRGEVRDAIQTIAKRAPVHANRCFAYLRQAFNFALERDWVENSPCAAVKAPSEERTRTRVLDDDEIRKLWTALDSEPQVIADTIRVLLFTGQRSGEVFKMRWSELDAEGWWTLPEGRTKNSLPHRVFLTKPVRDILERRHKKYPDCEWCFRSPKRLDQAIGSIAKRVAALRTATGIDFTPHDLRRTMATVAPRAGVPELTIPKMLGHVPPGVTRKHYNLFLYDAEKKLGWELWAKEVDRILRAKDEKRRAPGKVVSLFARA